MFAQYYKIRDRIMRDFSKEHPDDKDIRERFEKHGILNKQQKEIDMDLTFEQAWKLMEDGKMYIGNHGIKYKSHDGYLYFYNNSTKAWEESLNSMRQLFSFTKWKEWKEPVTINPCPACGSEMHHITTCGAIKDEYLLCSNDDCVIRSNPFCNQGLLISEWNASTEKKEPEAIKTPSCIRCGCTCFMP